MPLIIIRYAAAAAIIAALFGSGYLMGCRDGKESAEPVTDTLYVDRKAPSDKVDVPDPPDPVTVIKWMRPPEVDTLECPVPTEIASDFRITSPAPLSITSRNVEMTWFVPGTGIFETLVYGVPVRKWGLWLDAGAECFLGCFADARVNVRYRAITAFGGYGVDAFGNRAVSFGARMKLVGWR